MKDFFEGASSENIELLYKAYPVLKEINEKNNGIIEKNIFFKKLNADEYLLSTANNCPGLIFVIKGVVKIQRINLEGGETNLYNIESGDLCHEALSCLLKYQPLDIVGKALVDSDICVINFDTVKTVLLKDNSFLQYMYQDIYRKFGMIIENKEKIMHEDLETRLLKLLINKKSNIIYAKHSELALEVDSTRESISRKLKSIENLGYISLTRGKIVVLKDLKELLKE
jgi:CRP/FNR family transcriptional regulator